MPACDKNDFPPHFTQQSQTPPASFVDLFRLVMRYKASLMKTSLFSIASATITLVLPKYITRFFDAGKFHKPSSIEIIGLIAILLLSGVTSAFQTYYLRKMGEDLVHDIRADLSMHMLNLPVREYDQRGSGDLLSRLNSDTSKLRDVLLQGVTSLASGSILIIGSTIYMLLLDPILFCITALLLLTMLFLVLVSSNIVKRASLSNQKELGNLTSAVNRDLVGIRTIRAANASRNEAVGIRGIIDRVRQSGLKVAKIQALISPLATIGLEMSAIIVLFLGFWLVSTGRLSVETLTQFIILLFIVISPLSQIMLTGSQIGEFLAAFSRITDILAVPEEESINKPASVHSKLTQHIPALKEALAVEFRNISFSYDTKESGSEKLDKTHNKVLSDLELQIKQGSFVAFVGPSGAGKSTILQLIERFYEPDAGTISVFGTDIATESREKLRSHLAYVEQDSPTLSGTLRDNLLLGGTAITDERCRAVLRSVNLGHLLTRSGEGLDLQIGEQGATLSGGERQRLSIARALLSTAEIILLDEATANLDAQNERLVMQLLNDSVGKRTFIFVAHRLATITNADTIHVFEHGRIIGSGTHDQLISNVPLYRYLAREQHLL